MNRLEGKIAVVTGSARGIGRAIVEKLAAHGAKMVISCDMGESSYEQGNVVHKILNVTDREAIKTFVNEIEKEYGKIDILVNNAGITKDGLLMRMTEDQWDAVINVNLKGVFNMTQAVSRSMLKARKGSIITLSSVVGLHGNAGQTNYAATKGGVVAMSKTWAKEFGGRNVRANCVAPGFIQTPMTDVLSEDTIKGMFKEEEMSKVYVVAAKRTAIGSFLGTLSPVKPGELGAKVVKNIIEETGIDPANIDEVIVGNVLSAGQAQGVGRQVAIKAGVPYEVPAYSVNIICGSGMKSVILAYSNIKSGESDLVIAGGTESMSGAGFILPGTIRGGHKMADLTMKDHMILDALTDAYHNIHMGITAENIAEKYGITREEQDAFALESQKKAVAAVDAGKFKDEIVPVVIPNKKGDITFDTDEYPNRKTDAEKLAKLKPAFKKDGSVTAGNASGLNDGASFLMLASEEAVKKYNLKPLVEIVATGTGGVDPLIMGMGPVPAIRKALKKANLKLQDMQLIELNEAFAAQSLGVIKELCTEHGVTADWFKDKTNVNGGAIALGHPVGASGNRITVTLIHEMKKTGVEYGLASLCIGGGMGTALVLKNVK